MSEHTKIVMSKNGSRASSKSKESLKETGTIVSQLNFDKLRNHPNAKKQLLNSSKLSNGQTTHAMTAHEY
jgi:hypothetical protein